MESEVLNKAIVGRWFAPDVVLQYSMHNPRRGQVAVKHFMADFREAFS